MLHDTHGDNKTEFKSFFAQVHSAQVWIDSSAAPGWMSAWEIKLHMPGTIHLWLGNGDTSIFLFNVGCWKLDSSSSSLWLIVCLAKSSCVLCFETSMLCLVPIQIWPTCCNGTHHCHTTHWLRRQWTSCCLQHLLASEQRFVENSSLVPQWPNNWWQASSSCRCSQMCFPLGTGCGPEFHQLHPWHQGFQASGLSNLSSQTHPSIGEFLLLLGV